MNKRKLGAAVLLLALGLGPVQTGQNYDFKLNNLVYAEDSETGVETANENKEEEIDKTQTDYNDQEKPQNEDGVKVIDDDAKSSGKETGDDTLEISKEKEPTAVKGDVDSDKETIKGALEAQDKEVRESEAFKLASQAEIKDYETKYSAIEEKLSEYLGENKDIEDPVKELKRDFLIASMDLGYTVVENLPKRMELRRLKAELEAASKEAKKEYSEELKNLIKKTDDILASKEYTSEEIEANLTSLNKAVEAYKTDNSVNIEPLKLSDEEAKYGYPDDVYSDTRGRDKDLSELRLDARIMLEDSSNSKKSQERTDLDQKRLDPEIKESDLLDAINAYKKSLDKSDDEYKKLVEEYEEVKNSDIYKNASDEKKKAYDDALKEFKKKEYKTKEELEAGKAKMEVAKKALSEKAELEKEIESVLGKHNDFINTDNYRRATAFYQNAYKDAYKALTENKTKENLDKLKEAKTAIDGKDFVKDFNNKADQLESYIDKAKSDKITDESLKKLKEEYKEKLKALRDNKDADIDDIKALEDEFNEKLSPEKAEFGSNKDPKKTTKKVVTSSKKSKGKVRTGVDAILPVVGGVAIVAAIGLIFTRKKNK
ncbi:hypothetical protein [Anaerococcus sp.]|uniref:hypothetical protein n=1 Tax=Anaerococcus sp. TaxID=1872515 RepID=UPI0027B9AA6B|nr:hypothetical protein [Anaerococcus sp.]